MKKERHNNTLGPQMDQKKPTSRAAKLVAAAGGKGHPEQPGMTKIGKLLAHIKQLEELYPSTPKKGTIAEGQARTDKRTQADAVKSANVPLPISREVYKKEQLLKANEARSTKKQLRQDKISTCIEELWNSSSRLHAMPVQEVRKKMLLECRKRGIEMQAKESTDILQVTQQLARAGKLPNGFLYSAQGKN